MPRFTSRPSPALVVACLALLVALTGTSVAAVSQLVPRNSVGTAQLRDNAVARVKVRNNAINSAKVANRSLLAVDFARGQIPAGPPGPAGPAGAAGPAGPAGAAATSLWASVDAAGTLVRNKGVASTQRLGTGDYLVIFNQDVTPCIYQATLGGPTAGLFSGQVTAAQRTAIAAGVRVVTQNSTGVVTDIPFFVSVFC